MKELVARDQVRLGLARCFQLALSGMSQRLFRASITIAILALAVAFLSHMLAFSVIDRATRQSASAAMRENRLLGEIVERASSADAPSAIIAGLAGSDAHRLREYQTWSELSPAEFAAVRQSAGKFERFEAFLTHTNPAERAALFGDQNAEEAALALGDSARLARFLDQLHSFGLRAPLGSEAELKAFLSVDRPKLAAAVSAIAAGHARAARALSALLSDETRGADRAASAKLFEQPPPGLLEAAQKQGFDTSRWSLTALQAFALRARDRTNVEHAIIGAAATELARELDRPAAELSPAVVFGYVDGNSAHAVRISAILNRAGVSGLDAAKLELLAHDSIFAERVERAAGAEAPVSNAWFGISARNSWLVLLSFLVCGVGVANAMLMSVGERFAEIATMKCLGALDGFVMVLFLFEAAIQGVIGGVIGLILGGILALARGFAEFGTLLGSAHGAFGQSLIALLVALGLGVLLAALSAVGPSFVAARLSPMEAMRID
ncbi:MAG TPA: ABC transporter permease [Polyangiaceae bacterium]|nr:ABC transporter permease [Polyangiaceae bacterium]